MVNLRGDPGPEETVGIVLAGGSSTRLQQEGAPVPGGKIWLPVAGRPLLEIVCARLALELAELIVVAAPGQELPPLPEGVTVIADTRPGAGPLAALADGMRAALAVGRGGGRPPVRQALVASADVPLVSPAVIRLLCGALVPLVAGEPAAEAPLWAVPLVAGHPQVLLSTLSLQALPDIEAYLATGRRDPRGLLEALRARTPQAVRIVAETDLLAVDPGLESFLDVDTWADFLKVCEKPLPSAPGFRAGDRRSAAKADLREKGG